MSKAITLLIAIACGGCEKPSRQAIGRGAHENARSASRLAAGPAAGWMRSGRQGV